MPSLKTLLTQLTASGELRLDEARQLLRQRLRLKNDPQILPYFGYGTAETVFLKARVVQDPHLVAAASDDNIWENIVRTYQRIESDEIPHARVRATFGGTTAEATADEEGFIEMALNPTQPLSQTTVHHATFDLQWPHSSEPERVTTAVYIPSVTAPFGIISDIDDTILHSRATHYAQAARLMFTQNYHARLPFAGVSPFYHALTAQGQNPIFYVSSSPWNLFDMLTDFMEFQDIPLGPLFLKDYGLSRSQLFSSGHGSHKLAQIDKLMTTYPRLSFVLIGDSGQKDPEIYREAVRRYPGRIAAIYIRDVTNPDRDHEVQTLAAEVRHMGVEMVLVPDSAAAATHAATLGLISAESAQQVRQTI